MLQLEELKEKKEKELDIHMDALFLQ